MTSQEAFDTPTKVDAMDGEVVLRGPDSVAVSMTPEAAEETANRLLRAAETARRQRDERPEGRLGVAEEWNG